MWLEINLENFDIQQNGFVEKKVASAALYTPPENEKLNSVRDLADCEQGIAIEVNTHNRHVSFGRDYLGQFPLLFIHTNEKLFLTDEILHIDWWIKLNNINLTLSEESLALYFSLGYVPQGITLYDEVKSCKNVTIYHFKNRRIIEEDIFTPIEESEDHNIADVGRCISEEVSKIAIGHQNLDIWCSGGIDSSIMAHCFNVEKNNIEILTLGYDKITQDKYGDGEIQYAKEMANHCESRLRYAQLSSDSFDILHNQFTQGHISPVIDTCVIAKYALAQAAKYPSITGEGGDPIFGGVKNTNVLFTHSLHPNLEPGWIYANAHCRFFNKLGDLFHHGKELSDFVIEYLNKRIEYYPGDLLRKLFYLNTIEKQGGMIFPQSYYPAKRHGISTFHPLTNLNVYRSAFRLTDNKRYIYPNGKLVLNSLFKNKIPANIVNRKKSGTIVPLIEYVKDLSFDHTFLNLKNSNYFKENIFEEIKITNNMKSPLFTYAFITLDKWLQKRKGIDYERNIPAQSSRYQQQATDSHLQ